METLASTRYLDRRVDLLSGGSRQKLNLTLMHDPDVLLLDEPYQGFDRDTYPCFWELAKRLRDAGYSVLVVSHLAYDVGRLDEPGFMMFAATFAGGAFDRRLAMTGHPRFHLVPARLAALTLACAAAYATAVTAVAWSPRQPFMLAAALFSAAMTYGALGVVFGSVLGREAEVMFAILMISIIDLALKNPLSGSGSDSAVVRYLPSYGTVIGTPRPTAGACCRTGRQPVTAVNVSRCARAVATRRSSASLVPTRSAMCRESRSRSCAIRSKAASEFSSLGLSTQGSSSQTVRLDRPAAYSRWMNATRSTSSPV